MCIRDRDYTFDVTEKLEVLHMDLNAIIRSLDGCPCGRPHRFDLKTYEADRGLVHKVGEILENSGFPKSFTWYPTKPPCAYQREF